MRGGDKVSRSRDNFIKTFEEIEKKRSKFNQSEEVARHSKALLNELWHKEKPRKILEGSGTLPAFTAAIHFAASDRAGELPEEKELSEAYEVSSLTMQQVFNHII